MTKEPADWAKIKAYRATWPRSCMPDDIVMKCWHEGAFTAPCLFELARMYDQYERPPVDPDLLAAREWGASQAGHESLTNMYRDGELDGYLEIQGFLAGVKHGKANP